MDEIHIEDKLHKWRAMVSLQRNWFPAMKLNCYNISVSCFTLNRILQSTSTSHHGSKSKTWLRCQHGVFWWCRINVVMRSVGCGWTRHDHQPLSCSWGDQFTNPGPATPSCRWIGWRYQGPRPTAWKMDFPDVTMKLSTKSYMAYLRLLETINHPPIHCPKWPRYPLSVFKWSTLVFDLRNSHMLPTKFSQSCPKGIPLTPEVEVISVTYNVI